MKIGFISFGCKVNQTEIEDLKQKLNLYKAEIAANPANADIVLVNSCAVTAKASDDVLRYIKNLKMKQANIKVALLGCMVLPEESGADFFLPNAEKQNIFKLLELEEKEIPYKPAKQPRQRTRALIKVQDGCDNYCTYCIIPYLRGKPVSLDSDVIVAKARRLLGEGYKEIVLTGIHIGLYEEGLPHLLDKLGTLDGDFRLRLSSLYPEDITAELLSSGKGKLAPSFHISLQSPDDEILARMGRHYKAQDFAGAIERIKKAFPDAGIGADVITGFPGETEAQFQKGINFLRRLKIDYLHVFPYSIRPGTQAADYPSQVSQGDKKRRASLLRKLSEELKARGAERMMGKTLRVLAEAGGRGHADNFWLVKCPKVQQGNFGFVTISGCEDGILF